MPYTRVQAATDIAKLLEREEKAEKDGDVAMAGMCRVEAHNCLQRIGSVKHHKPNVGPYSVENPRQCVHCGRKGEWAEDEECVPTYSISEGAWSV